MFGYLVIIVIISYILVLGYKSKSKDAEIIIGQKKEIRQLGEKIQEVLDAEKIEKKAEREHRSIITEANKLLKNNRLKQAEKKYLSIIKNDHNNIKAYQGLGSIYLEQEEFAGAAEVFKKVTELDPTNDLAFNNMGLAYMKTRKFADAVSAYEHAVALNSKIAHRYINLALAAEKNNDFKKQIAALEKAASIEPKMEYLVALSDAAIANDDKGAARKALEKITEIEPSNLEALRKLARLDS
jgi:tetratricopeptide (TPR) repeat protein